MAKILYILSMQRLTNFLSEVRIELKKVAWPTREEAIRFTSMVIIVSATVAIFLGALDFIFQYVLNTFIL